MKLNFLTVGAAKSGTTTLHDILVQHPNIYLPDEKDFHFFDSEDNYGKGMKWYQKKFTQLTNEKIVGEVSATYLYSQQAASRIFECFGKDVKIAVILRNPAKRAYSEYLHQKRTLADEVLDLNKYYAEKGKIDENMPLYSSIIERGFYFKHLQKYIQLFGQKNVEVLFLENLSDSPDKEINKLLAFLGVETDIELDTKTRSNPRFSPKSKLLHRMFYSEDQNALRQILKFMVPSFKYRQRIRAIFKKFNEKNTVSEGISKDLYNYLMNEVYALDIKSLESFLGSKIEYWPK
ncbi:sulfotransferase domain-containing protein [Flagellimonas sp. 2504JD4-2]